MQIRRQHRLKQNVSDQEGTLGHVPDEDLRDMSGAHSHNDLIAVLPDEHLKVSLSKVAPSQHHLVVVSLLESVNAALS